MTDSIVVNSTNTILTRVSQPQPVVVRTQATVGLQPGATDRVATVTERTLGNTVTEKQTVVTATTGPQGPQGPAGTGAATYVFNQPTASTLWHIAHGLGQFPSVTVVDTTDREIEGGVTYVDDNTIDIEFTYAQAGIAFLN